MAGAVRGLDAILHAADVCTSDVLDDLSAFAPVHAVIGNNDGPDIAAWRTPQILPPRPRRTCRRNHP